MEQKIKNIFGKSYHSISDIEDWFILYLKKNSSFTTHNISDMKKIGWDVDNIFISDDGLLSIEFLVNDYKEIQNNLNSNAIIDSVEKSDNIEELIEVVDDIAYAQVNITYAVQRRIDYIIDNDINYENNKEYFDIGDGQSVISEKYTHPNTDYSEIYLEENS